MSLCLASGNSEIWKDVQGYEGYYQVSNLGRVKAVSRIVKHGYSGELMLKEHILKPAVANTGYKYVNLCKDSAYKKYTIHRLVAKAFIENIENKPFVNHIDGTRINNSVDNLEWVTHLENMQHCTRIGRSRTKDAYCKPVVAFNEKEEMFFRSMKEAENQGFKRWCIRLCCTGVSKEHKGYMWKYA